MSYNSKYTGEQVEELLDELKLIASIDVSALFTVGGTIYVGLEELAKHTLYADGASVTCIPKLDEGKVILDRSVITYYGSGLTSRRDCAVVSGSPTSVITLEIRTKDYDLP